jgi:predicted DNA-binding ribbon-helix-helix protein
MGSATTPPGIAVTSIRIERERLDAFKRVAEANRRSVSQELRWLIDRHVEAHNLEKAA